MSNAVMNPAQPRPTLEAHDGSTGMDVDDVSVGVGTVEAAVGTEPAPHDHAWRRVRVERTEEALMLGEYRCDLCAKTWAM